MRIKLPVCLCVIYFDNVWMFLFVVVVFFFQIELPFFSWLRTFDLEFNFVVSCSFSAVKGGRGSGMERKLIQSPDLSYVKTPACLL